MLEILGAALLSSAGALLFYTSAPNQKLVPAPRSTGARRWMAALLLIAAAMLASLSLSGTAAIFVVVMLAMTVWSLLPLLAAWLRRERPSV